MCLCVHGYVQASVLIMCVCACKHASVRVLYGYIVDPSFFAWE